MSGLANQRVNLTTKNSMVIRGTINNESMHKAKKELFWLLTARIIKDSPIYIVLDTPGGSVSAGEGFISYAKLFDNVYTVTIYAASMGAIIVQSLPGKRYITEDGIMMSHRARVGLRGQIVEGEFESRYKIIRNEIQRINRRVAKRIGISIEDYNQKIKDEWWSNSYTAVGENVSDAVVDIHCSDNLIKKHDKITQRGLFTDYSVTFSGCPLFTLPVNE